MPGLREIGNYHKSGNGRMFQFYITDAELQSILENDLPDIFQPYTLISYIYDGNSTFHFKEFKPSQYLEHRLQKHDLFLLRSLKLSPDLEFPAGPVTDGHLTADYRKYYVYSGLVEIQHGFLISHKYFSESNIGLIDKYYDERDQEKLYTNEEYLSIFKALKGRIKKNLRYKARLNNPDGSLFRISKSYNVSEGFAAAVGAGSIVTNIQIE